MFEKIFNKKAKKTTTTDVEKTIMLYIVKITNAVKSAIKKRIKHENNVDISWWIDSEIDKKGNTEVKVSIRGLREDRSIDMEEIMAFSIPYTKKNPQNEPTTMIAYQIFIGLKKLGYQAIYYPVIKSFTPILEMKGSIILILFNINDFTELRAILKILRQEEDIPKAYEI